jgi:hypothetical protein
MYSSLIFLSSIGTGFAQISIVTNSAPTIGIVNVVPSTGYVLTTEFTLKTTKFIDDDLPLYYRYLIDSTKEPLDRFTKSNIKKTLLPLTMNHPLTKELLITVQVRDRFGASSYAETSVTVDLPISSIGSNDTNTVVTAIVQNATKDLKKIAGNGDPSTVLSTMRSITSLLNTNNDYKDDSGSSSSGSSINTGSGTSNTGSQTNTGSNSNNILSKEERNIRANARQELFEVLDQVSETLEPTPDNIYLQASVAKSLTSNLNEQNIETRIRASKFVVNLVDKQLNNVTKNVEINTANVILSTVSSVLRGVSSSSSNGGSDYRRRLLLNNAVKNVKQNIYHNMIDGTNKLATASILEAIPGEETTTMGTNDVQIYAGRFDEMTVSTSVTAATNATITATKTWSLASGIEIDANSLLISSGIDRRRLSSSSSSLDLRSVTWAPSLAPFNTSTKSAVLTVHLSSSTTPNDYMAINSTKLFITMEMKSKFDPRRQGCSTYANKKWTTNGMITTGWYSTTNTSHDNGATAAAGILLCSSSHLSDFSTIDPPIEIPEANIINFENDFYLIENYNPTNMYTVYVLIILFIIFITLCVAANNWQKKRYTKALKNFEFTNYCAGPHDFEGSEIPSDVSRNMFYLDISVVLQQAAQELKENEKNKEDNDNICSSSFSPCCSLCYYCCNMSSVIRNIKTFCKTFLTKLIFEHSWISIISVPDAHPFTPVQRLWVVWVMTLTNFAVIGLFFGKDPVSL